MLDRAKQMHLYHVLELNQSSNGKGYLLVSSYQFQKCEPDARCFARQKRTCPAPRAASASAEDIFRHKHHKSINVCVCVCAFLSCALNRTQIPTLKTHTEVWFLRNTHTHTHPWQHTDTAITRMQERELQPSLFQNRFLLSS